MKQCVINKSRQMDKCKFKNFDIDKRQKTQNILPIPYALLCIVLDSVIFSRKIKNIDTNHFMIVSYFVVGNGRDRILIITLKLFYTLLKQYLLTSNLSLGICYFISLG